MRFKLFGSVYGYLSYFENSTLIDFRDVIRTVPNIYHKFFYAKIVDGKKPEIVLVKKSMKDP